MLLVPIPHVRAWKISLRTVHLIAASILVGGYAFAAPAAQLRLPLFTVVASGTGMVLLEAYPRLDSVFQGWALLTWAKLALLCLVPHAGRYRLAILMAVIVLASIGSHMPARFRHYSLLYRRVIKD
jgi:hypothetical protein